ncbi:MAG: hypothetical protein WCP28_19660 [Actinomycetes bacterium]
MVNRTRWRASAERGSWLLLLAVVLVLALGSLSFEASRSQTESAIGTDAPGPSSATGSPTQQAWVRGIKATLTNTTGTSIHLHAGTEFSTDSVTLGNGLSVSAVNEPTGTSATRIVFSVKVGALAAVGFQLVNTATGSASLSTCATDGPSGCHFGSDVGFAESMSRTVTVTGADGIADATAVVTRGADDGGQQTWTVDLTHARQRQ